MNNGKKVIRSKKRLIIVLSAAVVTAVMLILTAIRLYDADRLPEFIKITFGLDAEESGEVPRAEIPDLTVSDERADVVYMGYSAEEILGFLSESDSCTRSLRTIFSYGNERTVIRYKVSVNGEKYRADSDSMTLICDGERVYIRNGVAEFITPDNRGLHAELGMTSLDELKRLLEENTHTLSLTKNNRYIRATLYDENGQLSEEYDISTEYGIVVTEYKYRDGEIYRAVVTDTLGELDKSAAFDIDTTDTND